MNTHRHCEFYRSRFSSTGWVLRARSLTTTAGFRGRAGGEGWGEGNSNPVSACDERSPSLKGPCLCCCPGSRVTRAQLGCYFCSRRCCRARGRGWQRARRRAAGETLYPHGRQRPGRPRTEQPSLRAAWGLRRQLERRFGPSLSRESSLAGLLRLPLQESESVMLPRRESSEGQDPRRQQGPMTESSLGAVLPETPEAKSGCVMMVSLSLRDAAVVAWHRERGAPDPCATQGHQRAKLVILELGKASHKAGCCCLRTIATAQTCSRAVAEALGPQPGTGRVCCSAAQLPPRGCSPGEGCGRQGASSLLPVL